MFYAGLDLGQRQDFTAIAVVERRDSYAGTRVGAFHSIAVRHVERMPLGTPYPAVVERVREIVNHYLLGGRCPLAVDATGVGAPVVEMLRSARLGQNICAVTITGGGRAHSAGSGWNVPKQDLMSGLRVLLERGELRIARDLRGARMLMRELMDMQARERGDGRMRFGAEGAGEHDDLVIALALACWKARQVNSLDGQVRII